MYHVHCTVMCVVVKPQRVNAPYRASCFRVSLILILFFIIVNFLNKKESKVICMREFEITLLQAQSLSI
jgi:hypothetical protein